MAAHSEHGGRRRRRRHRASGACCSGDPREIGSPECPACCMQISCDTKIQAGISRMIEPRNKLDKPKTVALWFNIERNERFA